MRGPFWQVSILVGSLLAALAVVAAPPAPRGAPDGPQQPAATQDGKADGTKEERKPALSMDLLKAPGGAVLVLYEEAKEALRLLPKAVVLTPEKYQELLDQLELLRRQLKPERPQPPSVCRLSGRVDRDGARVRAQYEFKTERPRSAVVLGGRRAWAVSATLADGQLPTLQPPGEEGYVVFLDKAGTYQLTVDFALPLQNRGGDRSIDLDLPRAAITTVEQLDLPDSVAEVRMAGRTYRTRPSGTPGTNRLEAIPLGPADRLDLSWRDVGDVPRKVPTILAARGRLVARVEEALLLTEAELTLQVLSGATAQWRVQMPPTVTLEKVQVLPALGSLPPEKAAVQDERVEGIDYPTEANSVLTIRLKEASADPLRVILHARQLRKGGALAVGPFAVFDVRPQHGTIEVRGRSDLRFRPVLRGEVVQREVTEEMRTQGTVVAFTYWDLPPAGRTAGPVPAPLALELETVRGVAEARSTHTAALLTADEDVRPVWRLTVRLDVTPVRSSADRLEIELPAGFQYDEGSGVVPADIVENPAEVREGPGPRKALLVKLAQRQSAPFHIQFRGHLPGDPGKAEAALELPRLIQIVGGTQGTPLPLLDRGGRLQVTLPSGLELAPRVLPDDAVAARGAEPASWTVERMPTRLEVAWQAKRAEAAVRSVAEITLGARRALVRQRFQFVRPPRQVRLRVPADVLGPVRTLEGSEVRPAEEGTPAGTSWTALLGPLQEDALTLTYSVRLPDLDSGESARPLAVPLLLPEGEVETKVLVWADADLRVRPAGTAWEELSTEPGSDPDRLPDLVLRGRPGARLLLQIRRDETAPHAAVTVERALIRVGLAEAGGQTYRARFLLSKLHTRRLDLTLPAAPGRAGLSIRLDGKEVRRRFLDEAGRDAETGRTVRLDVEPELYRKPVVLDVHFMLDLTPNDRGVGLVAPLRPPVVAGAILLGRARWAVEMPPDWMPVYAGGATTEQRWGLWGWLPAPRPAASAEDLEMWFSGQTPSLLEESEPSLVCWQSVLAPARVLHVPRQAWLLVCSLTFLAIGLGLSFLPLPRAAFWAVVAALGLALAMVGVLWPSTLPAVIYGCYPAALVLLVVVCAQWMVQQRYRRRLIFMPGFTRVAAGSALVRGNGSRLAPREPSTVDQVPGVRGNSVNGGGAVGAQGS